MTARILGQIGAVGWAIQPAALETILDIALRATPDEASLEAWKARMPTPEALAARRGDKIAGTRGAQVRDGVAVLTVNGPIFRYANLMTDLSGATSLEAFAQDLAVVAADSRVKSILLAVDSPGGEMTGLAEAAQQIQAVAASKPVVAFVEGLGASAAYQIAAAASEVVVSSTAVVGCLGVVMAHVDRRQADAKAGVVRREIVSSQTPSKRPDPATDTGLAQLQAVADRLGAEFLDQVAASRGMTVDALLAATSGGGLVVGADAVAAGLADRVGSYEDTVARLASGDPIKPRRTPRPAKPRASKETTMNTEAFDTKPVASDAPAAPPPLAASEPTAPAATTTVDAVAAERSRCAAIQAAALPHFSALTAQAVEEGWTAAAFIRAQDNATKGAEASRRQDAGNAFRASLPAPAAADHTTDAAVDVTKLPPEERAKAEFAADPKLAAEFDNDVGNYAAFLKAQAAGKVHVLGAKRGA